MSRPVRIRMIRTRWEHWSRYGGITRYLDYLPQDEFAIQDHATRFIRAQLPPDPPRWMVWLHRAVQKNGMRWYAVDDFRAELRAFGRLLRGGVDIVHFMDPEHGLQYLPPMTRWLPSRARPRLLATFHQPPALLARLLRHDVIPLLDHVALVSPHQAEYFDGRLAPEKISTILHGVDTEFFVPASRIASRSGPWKCLTVGHNLRDFGALRAVADRLRWDRDVHFHVVAPPGTGIEALANVTLHSGLSDEALRAQYQDADVLLLPLTDATANNALLEAFACGLPTITTELPAVCAYAPDGEAILVRNNDPDAIVDALATLRSDAALHARLRVRSRRRAEQLNWRNIAPEYAAIYRRLAQT